MKLDELQVLITANTAALRSEISRAQSGLNNLSKTSDRTANAVTKGFNFIKTSVLAVGLGALFKEITGGLDSAISRVDTLNNYTKVMSNLGVNGNDATVSIKKLSDALIGLPTTLDSAVLSVQRFTSANGNVKASTEMFLALNNAILAGGASTQIQATALEQLSQSYAKGKPDMVEWRSALTAMPAQLNQVAKAMGYIDSTALGEALTNGKVSMNDFMTTVVKLNKQGVAGFNSFEEQARNATGGISTSITNVKTAMTRGMADIMNAIGQSNIAGFFQNIAKVINNTVPYITAFVKICSTSVSYINALFGGKSKKKVDSTTNSLNNLGTSAGSTTSKGLDKATGSAKKLNKELNGLASFDEMNVLTESKNSSSGDSSGTGDLSGIDLSDFDASISDASNAVDKLYDKMLNTLKWFTSDMNFNPLVDSFKNLGDSIDYFTKGNSKLLKDFIANCLKPLSTWTVNKALPEFFNTTATAIKGIDFDVTSKSLNNLYKNIVPFTENVGEGLLWFYKDVLVPVGLWNTNKVLPEFLNLVSNGIKVLDNTIDELKPSANFLWSNFLSPLGKWTGGIAVTVLKDINSVLTLISKNKAASTIVTVSTGFKLLEVSGLTAKSILAKIGTSIANLSSRNDLLGKSFKTATSGISNFLSPTKKLITTIKSASTVAGQYTTKIEAMMTKGVEATKKTNGFKTSIETLTAKVKNAKTEFTNFTTKVSNGIQTWYNTSSAIDKVKVGLTGLAGSVVSLQGFSQAMKQMSEEGVNFGNVATSVVSGLGSIASATMTGVSVGGVYGGVIGGIAGTIGLVISGLSNWNTQSASLTASLENSSAIYKSYQEQMDNITNSLNSSITASQKNIEVKMTEIANAQELSSEMESFIDVNGRVKAGYEERANVILTTLNNALGTQLTLEGNVIKNGNEMISSKEQFIDVVNRSADAIEKETMLQGYQAQYKAAIEAQIDAKKAYKTCLEEEQKVLEKAIKTYNEQGGEAVDLQEIYNDSAAKTKSASEKYKGVLNETNSVIKGLKDVTKSYANDSANELGKTIEKVTSSNKKSTKEIEVNYKSTTNTIKEMLNQTAKASEKAKNSLDEMRKKASMPIKASVTLDTSPARMCWNSLANDINKSTNSKSGFNVHVNTIPKFAVGGIVDKPTFAMIGEAGKEAVMPLERNTGWIDELASKLSVKGGNGSNKPIQLVVNLGNDTLYEGFIDYTNEKGFEMNGEVFDL